jgi:outer membrane protein
MKIIRIMGLMSLVAIVVCISAKADAQDNKGILRISLDEAIVMALDASEDVQISDNEIARSNSEFREERSEIFPHISGLATWSNNYKYPDIVTTAAMKEYSLDAGIAIDQKLFTFGRISNAISAARNEIDVSRWEKEATKQEIIYITKLAYYNICLTNQVFDIFQQSYERAQENKIILQGRSASGRVSKYDNIKIAADIASRLPSVNTARANLNSALQTLKTIIGVDSNAAIDVTDNYITEYLILDKGALLTSLHQNQPTLKALKKSIDANKDTIQEKRSEFFPEVSAFSTWNHKGLGDTYDVRSENLDDYGIAGLKVSLPIWEGGERKEELQQAMIDEDNARLNFQKATKNFLLDLENAIAEYHEFIKTLDANEDAVRLAQEAFKMSQDLFRSGQISVTDLNDSELLLTREKLNKETTLFNINRTLAGIEKLTLTGINNE